MTTTPYLNFDGNCKEAMTFYAKCLGGELEVNSYDSMPGDKPPGLKDRVMHASVSLKGAPLLMASDIMPGNELKHGNNVWVSLHCTSREEIDRLFAGLSAEGNVIMPLDDMFWGARFGMMTDRFGIQWMLNFQHSQQARA